MSGKNTVWVLTKSVNDYNQYGDYFVAVFGKKPNIAGLAKVMNDVEGVEKHMTVFKAVEFLQNVLDGEETQMWDSHFVLREVELK